MIATPDFRNPTKTPLDCSQKNVQHLLDIHSSEYRSESPYSSIVLLYAIVSADELTILNSIQFTLIPARELNP